MKTAVPKPAELAERWFLVDAKGQVLGRLATQIATVLRGKDQPTFSPHVPTDTHVVVVNAGDIKLTGTKLDTKRYYRHGDRPGTLRSRTVADELGRHPTRPLERAIVRMLPDNRLRKVWRSHLHLYAGADHPHTAQKPEKLETNG